MKDSAGGVIGTRARGAGASRAAAPPAHAIGRAAAVGAVVIGLLAACSSGPAALSSQRVDSPDGSRSAVVQEVDNGLGFGLGALVHEVHVVGATQQVRTHGDASPSLVFYANTTEYDGPPITARWVSNQRLRITYGKALRPGRQESQLGAVAVEYVAE